jgi:hypothetical protein
MTIYVHFTDGRPARKLFNIARLDDLGYSTVTAVNAFGGEPQRFDKVARVACEPERSEDDDEGGAR